MSLKHRTALKLLPRNEFFIYLRLGLSPKRTHIQTHRNMGFQEALNQSHRDERSGARALTSEELQRCGTRPRAPVPSPEDPGSRRTSGPSQPITCKPSAARRHRDQSDFREVSEKNAEDDCARQNQTTKSLGSSRKLSDLQLENKISRGMRRGEHESTRSRA